MQALRSFAKAFFFVLLSARAALAVSAIGACPARTNIFTTTQTYSTPGQTVQDTKISTTSGDCAIVTAANVTFKNVELGPCGADSNTRANGVDVEATGFTIQDSYIHPEHSIASQPCDTHDGLAWEYLGSSATGAAKGNVIVNGEANIRVQNTYNVSVIGNFSLNPRGNSSCLGEHVQFTGNSTPFQPSNGGTVYGEFGISCVQSGGGAGTGVNCNDAALPASIAANVPFFEHQEDGLNLFLAQGDTIQYNTYIGGHSSSGDCVNADLAADNTTHTNNVCMQSGGSNAGCFGSDGGGGNKAGNRCFSNIPGGNNATAYDVHDNYNTDWVANHLYSAGFPSIIMPTANNAGKFHFIATTGGTSQTPGPPTWPQTWTPLSGASVTLVDGGVTWTAIGPYTWNYNFNTGDDRNGANINGQNCPGCTVIPGVVGVPYNGWGNTVGASADALWSLNNTSTLSQIVAAVRPDGKIPSIPPIPVSCIAQSPYTTAAHSGAKLSGNAAIVGPGGAI